MSLPHDIQIAISDIVFRKKIDIRAKLDRQIACHLTHESIRAIALGQEFLCDNCDLCQYAQPGVARPCIDCVVCVIYRRECRALLHRLPPPPPPVQPFRYNLPNTDDVSTDEWTDS